MKIISTVINVWKVLVQKYNGNEETTQKTPCVWEGSIITGHKQQSGKWIRLAQHMTKGSSLDNEPSVYINLLAHVGKYKVSKTFYFLRSPMMKVS